MRTFNLLKTVILNLIFLLALPSIISAQENEKVIRLVSDEWCPFQCVGEEKGITFDILKDVFEPEGYKITQELIPWSRAISSLRNGESTTFGNAAKADAPELIYAENSAVTMKNTLFINDKDDFEYKDVSSLAGGVLGVILSYTYGNAIDNYISNNPDSVEKLGGDDPLRRLLIMLEQNRIKYTIDDYTVTTYRINSLGLKGKIKPVAVLSAVPLHMGFSPKNPQAEMMAEKVSLWLQTAKLNGKLKSIYEKYGVNCDVCL